MNLLWLTDIHLNFLELHDRMGFCEEIRIKFAAAILNSGDIAEATSIYFVLGKS